MLIHRIAAQLATSAEYRQIERSLGLGDDATLAIGQSARSLITAALFARTPRPTLVVLSGEDAAESFAAALRAYLGNALVERYPRRPDFPWSDDVAPQAVVGQRCQALSRLFAGEPCVVVASAGALLRKVPPRPGQARRSDAAQNGGTDLLDTAPPFFQPLSYQLGQQLSFERVPHDLMFLGYENTGGDLAPGTFHVHGDSVDVLPAQGRTPVRLEFFGDEIDGIRRVLPGTGQTIGGLESITLYPCRELALTPQAIDRASRKLVRRAYEDETVAAQLEMMQQGVIFPQIDRYLGDLYPLTASPLDYLHRDVLLVLAEPRSLLDDATRAYDDIAPAASAAGIDSRTLQSLFQQPAQLDFGSRRCLTYVSLMRVGTKATAEMRAQAPDVAGGSRLIRRLQDFSQTGMATVFAVPDSEARHSIALSLTDAHVPIVESLANAPENAQELVAAGQSSGTPASGAPTARASAAAKSTAAVSDAPAKSTAAVSDAPVTQTLRTGVITLTDTPVQAGIVLPDARLAVVSAADLSSRMARHAKRKAIDVTDITFPFKPGDYVVHVRHGIAYFSQILRREVDGRERDYFLLEYAEGDKLYVPFEQVDRITRYVGPDSSAPRLTRLNTADWSRATSKARKAAKKLAFDLVDLYARRASAQGYRYAPDSSWQREMEEDFPYELTRDQEAAIQDIKADMESPRPMDRLLCGDVGFGKTEVALRAAFKAVQDGKQVMFLCPTTILAQQHYQTLQDRFAPYNVQVDVLSRFRTSARQKKSLEGFAAGEVQVLVGTHRLLSGDVNPKDLGLVIIDEEQRFGVSHKEQLKNLREQVDVLTLSATPIPRTMQMALSGARDMSLIKTAPPNRRPIKVHVGEWDEDVVSSAIRLELARDGQVYYVTNRVQDIDDATRRVLSVAPEARVGVAHGQMSAREIENQMQRFVQGEVDVLIATTIIESGIDNPHTNTLIIEDAQRLGLAQLYQLKGRVGRGRAQAYAYFMFPPGRTLTGEATDRLLAIREFTELGSGIKVAMRDLEIRGAGSLMGAEQHGNLSSVGFDLYTQMLGQAVAQAKGEVDDADGSPGAAGPLAADAQSVTINLPVDYYLGGDYVPDVDKRVLVYRKLAYAQDLATVDELEKSTQTTFGELPVAARNLFDRARIRIRANRLGISAVNLLSGKINLSGADIPAPVRELWRKRGGIVFAKTRKASYPFHKGEEELLPAVLGLLEEIGGADEDGATSS